MPRKSASRLTAASQKQEARALGGDQDSREDEAERSGVDAEVLGGKDDGGQIRVTITMSRRSRRCQRHQLGPLRGRPPHPRRPRTGSRWPPTGASRIFHSALDIAEIVRQIQEEGQALDPEDLAHMPPCLTERGDPPGADGYGQAA
ncbi:hypothetical protein CP975_01025 [Streptomyces alboniger]|uniref:Uncharacterized protein n=1 Tax=Streptomyces alboniger TaxID=132473 RepID=A0A5J6HGU5_STRAD|nr:hypothetical protein CP975_01025 [Streptomyces alboniger]